MGLLENLRILFSSLAPVYELFRGYWALLPFALQVVILLSFSGTLIIGVIKLLL